MPFRSDTAATHYATTPCLSSPQEVLRAAAAPYCFSSTLTWAFPLLQTALEELFGPTLHLNASTLEVSFQTAFQRLHTTFYRSKLTSWMAAQEEDYRWVALSEERFLQHGIWMANAIDGCSD